MRWALQLQSSEGTSTKYLMQKGMSGRGGRGVDATSSKGTSGMTMGMALMRHLQSSDGTTKATTKGATGIGCNQVRVRQESPTKVGVALMRHTGRQEMTNT